MLIDRSRLRFGCAMVLAVCLATSVVKADPVVKIQAIATTQAAATTQAVAAGSAVSTTRMAATTQAVAATQPVAAAQLVDQKKQLDDLWEDLAKQEPWSSRAILDFYDKPAVTVPFFKEHLKPLKIDQKEMDDAFVALGNEDEKVWKPAFDKLQYFDPRLNKDVATLLNDVTDPLARCRLVAILTGCQPDQWKGYSISYVKNANWAYLMMSSANGNSRTSYGVVDKVSQLDGTKVQWQRADRALVLLQHIATPEAIALLKEMASGNPAAQPTKIAKAALQSLGETVKW